MYYAHPSAELRRHFERRPFQGADPADAKFLFVGLDANYNENIESSASFTSVLEYHCDGVSFWQRHGVHHPFLLPTYRGDGKLYHRNFARIGFMPEHAGQVSFVELLHVPTVGRSQLEPQDLDSSHLATLDSWIRRGQARHIFLPYKVVSLMHRSRAFSWLPRRPPTPSLLRTLYSQEGRSVYLHLHFSNYGKFQQRLATEAVAINGLL